MLSRVTLSVAGTGSTTDGSISVAYCIEEMTAMTIAHMT